MSDESTRPRRDEARERAYGEDKAPEGAQRYEFPDCCRPMIENMKKAFAAAAGGDSSSTGPCGAMMAKMMKSCPEASSDEPQSAPHEDQS